MAQEQKNDNINPVSPNNARDYRIRFRQNQNDINQNAADVAAQNQMLQQQAAQLATLVAQMQGLQQNTDINIESIDRDAILRAEARDIMANLTQPIVYPLGRQLANEGLLDAEYRSIIRRWESFCLKYEPKLAKSSNIPKWFCAFENSCEVYNMSLEFRYKKIIQMVMDDDLRRKHAIEKTEIYDGIGPGYPQRYAAVRQWLTPLSSLRITVTKALRALQAWTPSGKSIAENLRDFKTYIHEYIYQVRFAITHGMKAREFNSAPLESTLVQDFCAKVNNKKIRIRMQRISDIENIAVLEIVCKQIDSEDIEPLGYKKQSTASIYALDTQQQSDEPEIEFLDEDDLQYIPDQEILWIRHNGQRRPARYRNNRSFRNNRGQNRHYGSYDRNYTNSSNNSTSSRVFSNEICPECVTRGHNRSTCYSLKKRMAYAEWLKVNKNATQDQKMDFVNKPRVSFKGWTPSVQPTPTTEPPRSIMMISDEKEPDQSTTQTDLTENSEPPAQTYQYQHPRHL